jgi:hypothetical protein
MRLLFGLLLTAAAPALAQDLGAASAGRNAQGDVAVTIYNNNLALVQDRRDLTLPAGRSRQEFPDVSAQIRPETVTLSGAGIGVVEQNFDFDLLSPAALMQKAVGETITLIRTNPATGAETRERALVLAANNGVVLRIGDRIEVLRDDGLPARVIFDKVPENLRPRPTLSVTVEADRGGRQPVTLTYLTPGLGWSADYVALFDEAKGTMDVQGWITLTNNSGTPFANANTLLVAGAVGQASDRRYRGYPPPPPAGGIRDPGTETAGRERLGDFYLYPLAERTTIANAQTKQVSFLDVGGAPARALMNIATAGWARGTSRSARIACCASPRRAAAGLAMRCPPERSASISAMRAARRSSSAKARSAIRRWAASSASSPARRSTSRSSRRSKSANACRATAPAGAPRCATA